MPKKKIFFSPI